MIQDVQEIARVTLANCAAFQTLVNAEDATEALAKIYHDSFPMPESGGVSHTLAEMNALRPCAIVYTEENAGFVSERDAMGDSSGNAWGNSGCIHLIIFRNVPTADKNDPGKVDTDFRTIIGNILSNIVAQSETAGRLNSRRITFIDRGRTDPKELESVGDAQATELVVEWGLR